MSTPMNIEIKVAGFVVPECVIEVSTIPRAPAPPSSPASFQRPFIEPRQFQLSELSAGDLESMCSDFRKEVFRRADKKRPRQIMPAPERVTVPRDVVRWAEQFRHISAADLNVDAVATFILSLTE